MKSTKLELEDCIERLDFEVFNLKIVFKNRTDWIDTLASRPNPDIEQIRDVCTEAAHYGNKLIWAIKKHKELTKQLRELGEHNGKTS